MGLQPDLRNAPVSRASRIGQGGQIGQKLSSYGPVRSSDRPAPICGPSPMRLRRPS